MAAIFLIDRIGERRRTIEAENAAIAYHLSPTAAVLIRDDGNPGAEFQMRLMLLDRFLSGAARAIAGLVAGLLGYIKHVSALEIVLITVFVVTATLTIRRAIPCATRSCPPPASSMTE